MQYSTFIAIAIERSIDDKLGRCRHHIGKPAKGFKSWKIVPTNMLVNKFIARIENIRILVF